MKKILVFFITVSLLIMFTPIIYATAPFEFYSSFTRDYIYGYDCDYGAIVSDGNNKCYFYAFKFSTGVTDLMAFCTTSINNAYNFGVRVNQHSDTISASCDVIDLLTGTVSTFYNEMASTTNGWAPPKYINSSSTLFFYSTTDNITYNNTINHTDPFIVFARNSNDYINAPFPKPLYDPYHSYFADSEHFYIITSDIGSALSGTLGFVTRNQAVGDTQTFSNSDGFLIYDAVYPAVTRYGNNQYKFILHNNKRGSGAQTYYIGSYSIYTGSLIAQYTINVPSNDTSEFPFYISNPDRGYWSLGLTQEGILDNIPLLNIRWNETTDYSTQLNSLISLLQNLYQLNDVQFRDYLYNMTLDIDLIKDYVGRIMINVIPHYQWFEDEFYNDILDEWDLTNTKLDRIINILEGDGQQTTLPIDPEDASNVNSLINQETPIMNDFEAYQDEIDYQFSNINGLFRYLSNGFQVVRNLFNTFTSFTWVSTVILFSLTFGIIILIIGKKVGG